MKKGWEYKKLGEVGTFKRGGNFSKKDFIENGFPCIHYGQIHMKFGIETFKHLSSVPAEMVKPDRCAQKGDLVIAVTSEDDAGSCKCTAWMGDYEAYVGGHAAIYRHTMEPKYVSYYFMSPYFQKAKLEYTHGFKVVEINPKDIAKISIPIPPLSEQKEIVEYLDSSFAKIDKLKENAAKNLEEAKALFQSALKDALEPKEGWEEKNLGELSSLITKGASPKWQGFTYVESNGILFVTSENVREGYVSLEPAKYLNKEFNNKQKRSILKYNDLLINIVGASIGRAAIFRLNINDANINQAVALVRLLNNVDVDFINYILNSNIAWKQYDSLKKDSARANLSLENIRSLKIPLPPLSEQQSIVSFLDSLSEKVNTLQQNYSRICDECDALKQAILRQVFE